MAACPCDLREEALFFTLVVHQWIQWRTCDLFLANVLLIFELVAWVTLSTGAMTRDMQAPMAATFVHTIPHNSLCNTGALTPVLLRTLLILRKWQEIMIFHELCKTSRSPSEEQLWHGDMYFRIAQSISNLIIHVSPHRLSIRSLWNKKCHSANVIF